MTKKLKIGQEVQVKGYAGTWTVVSYIPKRAPFVKKELRGSYCVLGSAGQSLYLCADGGIR